MKWDNYWRSMFPTVTEDAIEEFKNTYQHSAEEKADVLKWYEEERGDMKAVFDSVMLSEEEQDMGRFVHDYILPAIAEEKVPRFEAFAAFENVKKPSKMTKKKSNKKLKTSATGGEGGGLAAMIQARKSSSNDLFEQLSSKYGGGKKSASHDIDDEEFEKIQKRMEENRKKSKKK